jgi:TnpA family transposase
MKQFSADSLYQIDTEERFWIEDSARIEGRLALALMLKFFQAEGCWPVALSSIPASLISCLSDILKISPDSLREFDWNGRTARRFRNLVRTRLGFRPATQDDRGALITWLNDTVMEKAPSPQQCCAHAAVFFSENQIEPMAPDILGQTVRRAVQAYEEALQATLAESLSQQSTASMEALIGTGNSDSRKWHATENLQIQWIRHDLKGTKLSEIQEAVRRAVRLKEIGLREDAMEKIPRAWLLKYARRAAVESPSHLRENSARARHAMLACLCFSRQQSLTDQAADALLKMIQKLRTSAETHVVKQIVSDVKRVNGKFDILHKLARVSADRPEGIIRETIYPEVGRETLDNLATELSYQGRWYQHHVSLKMRALYSSIRRKKLFSLLEMLDLNTDVPKYHELLKAVRWILTHKDDPFKTGLNISSLPYINQLPALWKDQIVNANGSDAEENSGSSLKTRRMAYEMAILEMLEKPMTCKSIWVRGAWKYRHPDKDLPSDFDERKSHYFQTLGLPEDGHFFVQGLRELLTSSLVSLNQTIPENDQIKIMEDGHIRVSPFDAQPDPPHLRAFHQAIQRRWSGITLLDLLKEADFRTGLTRHFQTAGHHELMDPAILRKRLLLCIYALGSNTGLRRMGAANTHANENDLRYVKKRYLNEDNIRAAIAEVVNAIIDVRDPEIWGPATTGCGCDSTQVSSWDQNLVAEWHARYREKGVMIYWHVDRNSTCIYSQLKTCTSSEVAAMIRGVLRHCTKMDMRETYTDTHGQSVVGFGICHLLNFDLRPRLKNISKQKLCISSAGDRKKYANLDGILAEPVKWELIEKHYKEAVRHIVALKNGIVDPEVLIRRFSRDNYSHPVYRALSEIGKAVKTIFLCRYLASEELRIEINDSLNVVERLNGIMGFIFYGKLGEVSSNRREEQVLSVLCLHLLQVCMVYINTLMIQKVLSSKKWKDRLTKPDWRALTPLIHSHINPYGLLPLDMRVRIPIESVDEE